MTGQGDIALPLGVVLELFWLDVIPLGAVIPPVASLSFFLVFCTALVCDWHSPAQVALPLLLALPCAYLGSMLERWQYRRNDLAVESLQCWIGGEGACKPCSPGQILARSLMVQALAQGLLFLALYAGLLLCLRGTVATLFFGLFNEAKVTWATLVGFSAVGAILALRTRRAYAVLVACVSVLLICNGIGFW